jgi:TetR/AcrR family transcriptional regulator
MGLAKKQKTEGTGNIRARRTAAILNAAEIEFSQKGYEGTSIQSIADRAGLTKWQIIYFFKKKENLYLEVMNRIFSEWDLMNLQTQEGNPRDVISNYIDNLFMLTKVKPQRNKLIINEMLRGAPVAMPLLRDRASDTLMGQTKKKFEQWIAEKRAKPIDPIQYIFLIWGSHHFFAAFEPEVAFLMGRDKLADDDWDHIIEQVKTVLLSIFEIHTGTAEK